MAQRGNISFDAIQTAARQGTGTQFQMAGAGAKVAGNALIYDANGNAIDSGAPPGGGAFPHTANLIEGDGAGNGADSGIAPGNVAQQNASLTLGAANALQGDAAGWQLATVPGQPKYPVLKPVAANSGAFRIFILPGSDGASSELGVGNAADPSLTNLGLFQIHVRDAVAEIVSGHFGTGVPITTQNFGESLSTQSATLQTWNIQFGGTNKFTVTPTSVTVPTADGTVHPLDLIATSGVVNHYVSFIAADSQNGVPAAGFNWASSQNSLINPANMIGSNTVMGVLPFPKAAAPEMQGNFFLAPEFVSNSAIGVTIYWRSAGSGPVVWSLGSAVSTPGGSTDPTLTVTAVTDSVTAGTLCVTTLSVTPAAGANGLFFFSLTRSTGDAGDTLAQPADLIGVVFRLKMQNV